MLRNKRFYIPKEEIVRDYKDRHTITPMDIICKCDRVDDDDEYE